MRAVRLVIGTTNPAKLRRYQTILERLAAARELVPTLEVLSLRDLPMIVQAVQVEEDGATALENARKKARTYACASGLPTLGIDEALMVTGLAPEEEEGRLAPVYAAVRQLFQASARGLGAYADGGNDDNRQS